jgi:hypothetical protein
VGTIADALHSTRHPSVRQLALKRGLAWTGIWGLLFVLYLLVMGLGSFGM